MLSGRVPHRAPGHDVPRLRRGAPGRDRTCDQVLRRHLLYPLSYGRSAPMISSAGSTGPPARPGAGELIPSTRNMSVLGEEGQHGGDAAVARTLVADAELGEDRSDVLLDGREAQVQGAGDRRVGAPGRHLLE